MLSDNDIERIAVRVAELISPNQEKYLTMKEAAVFMGIKAKDGSLPSIFSKFSSIRFNKSPLRTYRVGRERTYKKEDLEKFMNENGRRN